MEPLGITRAWTRVPSMKRNATITQNQETTSRQTLSPVVAGWACVTFSSRSRSAATASSTSAFTMSLHFQLHQLGRIAAGVARCAEFVAGVVVILDGQAQTLQRDVAERVSTKIFADFFHGMIGSDQFVAVRSIHAVVAGGNREWATDAHVNFGGARVADQTHDFAAGGAAHDGIVYEHDALALQHSTDGIEFQLHAEIPNGLAGFDERAADVVIANQRHAEGDAGIGGIADRCGNAGVWNRRDDVGFDRMFFGEQAAEAFAGAVHRHAENQAIGPRKINVLEHTLLQRLF